MKTLKLTCSMLKSCTISDQSNVKSQIQTNDFFGRYCWLTLAADKNCVCTYKLAYFSSFGLSRSTKNFQTRLKMFLLANRILCCDWWFTQWRQIWWTKMLLNFSSHNQQMTLWDLADKTYQNRDEKRRRNCEIHPLLLHGLTRAEWTRSREQENRPILSQAVNNRSSVFPLGLNNPIHNVSQLAIRLWTSLLPYFIKGKASLHQVGLGDLQWSYVHKVGCPHGIRTTWTLRHQSGRFRSQQLLRRTTCFAFLLRCNSVGITCYALQHINQRSKLNTLAKYRWAIVPADTVDGEKLAHFYIAH